MKILFVYPDIQRTKLPQLGICMLAAVARELDCQLDLFDLNVIPVDQEITFFQKKVDDFVPDIIAVSCRSNEWSLIQELFASIPGNESIKILGGPHATVNPDQAMEIADIVVMGEGEITFRKLLSKIASGEDYSATSGTCVRKDGKIVKNEMRTLIDDLDILPIPFWEIFANSHYQNSSVSRHFPNGNCIGVFERSRGCPYACSYCTNEYVRLLYKGKGSWRREKSAERVIEEIKLFREKYGLDGIYFIDEIMLTRMDKLKEFNELYVKEVNVPFVFMERPENMTDEKVKIIKESGAILVSIGIESGDEELRKKLLNRQHSQETIISAFKTAREHGLTTHAFTMVGFPGEDRESILRSYELVKQARPDSIQTTIFSPIKGTKLYQHVVEQGMYDPKQAMLANYYQTSPLKLVNTTPQQLTKYQRLITHYNSWIVFMMFKLNLPLFFFRGYDLMVVMKEISKEQGMGILFKRIIRKLLRIVFRN